MNEWFNQYGLIEDKPQPQPVQDNGIVNRAENFFLGGPELAGTDQSLYMAIWHHTYRVQGCRRFKKSPNNSEVISHDNLTSIMSLSYHLNWQWHKKLDIWWHVKEKPSHIRMIPFYLACKYWWCYPLWPLVWFIELWSVLPTNYVDTDRGRVVDVDGERLAHIKLEGTRSVFRPLFYTILRIKWGKWRTWMTSEYFWQYLTHPNRELAEKMEQV